MFTDNIITNNSNINNLEIKEENYEKHRQF